VSASAGASGRSRSRRRDGIETSEGGQLPAGEGEQVKAEGASGETEGESGSGRGAKGDERKREGNEWRTGQCGRRGDHIQVLPVTM